MCHVNKTTGRFPGNKKSDTMKPEYIYNGLEYTTKEINRTFKIKVNGLFNGKKINTLVGVSGLIKLVGVDYGMIYYCPQCGAYVGVHKGTDRAKGRLANAELRRCKIEAHRYFDELYKRGLMKRREAYKWLSDQLGLPPEYTHIGMFNPETCAKVVDVSKKYLLTMRFALRRQDKIKAHFEPNGDEMLNRIKESLTRFFAADRSEFPEGYREIEDCFNQLPGEPYPTIAINDVGNDDRMIEFYVTGKQYDVYHVAFKGFTKG